MTILIILILIIFNLGCIDNNFNTSDNYFSALELIDNATTKLIEYDFIGDFQIILIHLYYEEKEGRYSGGKIAFINILDSYDNMTYIMLYYEDGKFKSDNIFQNPYNEERDPIINISKIKLDSDEAYNIAVKESKIKSFIKDNNAYEDGINVYSDSDDGTVYYSLSWAYESGSEEEPGIAIYIDASTGEVLKIFNT